MIYIFLFCEIVREVLKELFIILRNIFFLVKFEEMIQTSLINDHKI